MCRKPKQKRTFLVKRTFEPDRMSSVNLQIAYEQLIPPCQYRVTPLEQSQANQTQKLPLREEVSV